MNRATKLVILNSIGLLWLLAGCASVQSPEGGPRDDTGPVLVAAQPPHLSTRLFRPHVVFTFNEFLDRNSAFDAVFISPIPEEPPKVWVHNRKLHVRFVQDIPPNTTCIVNVGPGLKDFQEKNPLEAGFSYAFSSGAAVDSGLVSGHVYDAFTGMPQPGMTMLLFEEDSVLANGYFEQKPLYAAQTDASGEFELPYLRHGRFRLLGVVDKDNSYSWSQANERIAVLEDNFFPIADTSLAWHADLISWVQDTLPPRVLTALPHSLYSLKVRFNEPLAQPPVVLLAQDTLPVYHSPTEEPEQLIVGLPHKPTADTFALQFRHLRDTANNFTDTLLAVGLDDDWDARLARRATAAPLKPSQRKPLPFGIRLLFDVPILLPEDSVHLALTLTDGSPLAAKIQLVSPFVLQVEPAFALEDSIELHLKGSFPLAFGRSLDTTYSFPYLPEKSEVFGSISATLKAHKPGLLLQLLADKKTVVREARIAEAGTHTFRWELLRAGDYRVRIIEDADNSGAWTPGVISPWRAPEVVHHYPEVLNLRANWELEGVQLRYPPKK